MIDRKLASQIRELENGYCNPMKLKYAQELREELQDRGYSKREIEDLIDDK
ncbi:hypothetical protein [Brucella sp. BZ]|uniref:hypothetical protein n=1 Tax=Brucella sp. BZ TaxID=3381346 RepID=UPI0039E7418C